MKAARDWQGRTDCVSAGDDWLRPLSGQVLSPDRVFPPDSQDITMLMLMIIVPCALHRSSSII